jgi:hypothetical protein
MLAMKIHLHSGERQMVDMLAKRGLCVSYARLRQISLDLGNTAIATWERNGVVFPLKATSGAFTTCGLDNIDYNSTSTTAAPKSMLHGTAIIVYCSTFPEQVHQALHALCLTRMKWGSPPFDHADHHANVQPEGWGACLFVHVHQTALHAIINAVQ